MRFYFDPNSIPMASKDSHTLLRALTASGGIVMELNFKYNS